MEAEPRGVRWVTPGPASPMRRPAPPESEMKKVSTWNPHRQNDLSRLTRAFDEFQAQGAEFSGQDLSHAENWRMTRGALNHHRRKMGHFSRKPVGTILRNLIAGYNWGGWFAAFGGRDER